MDFPAPIPDVRHADFVRLAIPYMDDVYRFALSLARHPTDAEDLVQETFLRAFRSWHTFLPGSDARRWLFTICRNAFLRGLERSRRDVVGPAPNDEATLPEFPMEGAERLLDRIDLGPALVRALDTLAEPFRSAVILVDVEDQSYDAASAILGVPVGTVRSRLHRGRRQLQAALREYARDAGFPVPSPTPVANDG